MSVASTSIRHGMGAVRPYLYGGLDLPDFLRVVFGAQELERNPVGGGYHVEVQIGDSVVALEVGEGEPPATATRSSVYVYVDDVDSAYQRALRMGATSVREPMDKPYQERNAGIRDTFGNVWWIGKYLGSR